MTTNADKVRAFLLSKGTNYIPVGELSDLIAESKIGRTQFIPAFYQLKRMGEIETDVVISDGGRRSIKGITIKKMPSVSTIIHNDGKKKKMAKAPEAPKLVTATLPNIVAYLEKKTVLAEISEKLATAGFEDDEVTINFEMDPMGEEALTLLDLVGRAQAAVNQLVVQNHDLAIDLETQTRISDSYAQKLKIRPEDYVEESK